MVRKPNKTIHIIGAKPAVRPAVSQATYAQFGEDRIIGEFFSSKNIRFPNYLDIGAGSPEQISNTYLLYENGSKGVLVEPDPVKCNALRSKRPKDTVIQTAVATNRFGNMATLYVLTDRYLNSLLKQEVDHMVKSKGWGDQRIEQEIQVPVVGINDLVRDHFPSGLDLLSVDVEGLDLEIVGDLDFKAYQPKLICIETLGGHLSFTRENAIDLMKKFGYSLHKETPLNSFFAKAPK